MMSCPRQVLSRALLKIYLYRYINQIQSSQRLERETQRNVGRLMPDFKTARFVLLVSFEKVWSKPRTSNAV
jgi:transposase